jgi:hypothetical protein
MQGTREQSKLCLECSKPFIGRSFSEKGGLTFCQLKCKENFLIRVEVLS